MSLHLRFPVRRTEGPNDSHVSRGSWVTDHGSGSRVTNNFLTHLIVWLLTHPFSYLFSFLFPSLLVWVEMGVGTIIRLWFFESLTTFLFGCLSINTHTTILIRVPRYPWFLLGLINPCLHYVRVYSPLGVKGSLFYKNFLQNFWCD